jgi:NADH-quinone oxidoreductase subunit A|eukprot:gene23581-gene13528
MTSLFFLESTKIGLIILFSVVLSCLIVLFSFLLGPSIPDSEKSSIYECGFDPYEDARNEFDVRFYLVAILFIIFDLETVFFFPWCVSLSHLNFGGFWSMLDFILELLVGYIYAWQAGALNWD